MVLLAVMGIGWFLSMWITNVAATVVVISVISPILITTQHDTYPKCLLLGIAFSCNIGGMTTPIASPQNLIANMALESANLETISFLDWTFISSFTSLIGIIFIYFFLWLVYQPKITRVSPKLFDTDFALGFWQYFVMAVTMFTIMLWSLGSFPLIKVYFLFLFSFLLFNFFLFSFLFFFFSFFFLFFFFFIFFFL